MALLAIESNHVVLLRCLKLARGGPAAGLEATQMIAEKMQEAALAAHTIMMGGSQDKVIARYRECVQGNAQRLQRGR